MTEKKSSKIEWSTWLILAAIIAVGTLLRLQNLGYIPFQASEQYLIKAASSSPAELLNDHKANFLSYLLLHFWLLINDSEVFARSYAILLNIFTLILSFLVARNFAGKKAGLFTVAIFTFSPILISSDRSLSIGNLMVLAALFSFLAYQRVEKGKSGIFLFLSILIGLYIDAVFYIVAILILIWSLIEFPNWKGRYKTFLFPMIAAIALWIPWLVYSSPFRRLNTKIIDYQLLDLKAHIFSGILSMMLSGTSPLDQSLRPIVLITALILVAIYMFLERKNRKSWVVFTLSALLVALFFGLNLIGQREYFSLMYVAVALTFLLLGIAFARLASVHIALCVLLLAPILGVWAHSNYMILNNNFIPWMDYRGFAKEIKDLETDGDALAFLSETQAEHNLYYYQGDLPKLILPVESEDYKKQTDELIKNFKRIILVQDDEIRYDHKLVAQTYFEKNGISDSCPDFKGKYNIPASIWFTSRKNAFLARWKSYDTFIDFSTSDYHPSQLDGTIEIAPPDVVVEKWARFYLKRPGNETTVKMILRGNQPEGKKPFSVFLLADGRPIRSFRILDDKKQTLTAELPEIQGELIEIGILVSDNNKNEDEMASEKVKVYVNHVSVQ